MCVEVRIQLRSWSSTSNIWVLNIKQVTRLGDNHPYLLNHLSDTKLPKLALNSRQFSCLALLSTRITVCLHTVITPAQLLYLSLP